MRSLVAAALRGQQLVAGGGPDVAPSDAAPEPVNPLAVVPFGFAAGFLGGAVAEPGPPAVVFGQSRRWDPATMRVMLFRFFLLRKNR